MLNINNKIKEKFVRFRTYLFKKSSFKLIDYPPNVDDVQTKI